MERDEFLVIRMRDCFTAGYTLPQYCIDNKIRKPLFVSEKKFLSFMWEIHIQFLCDKRMLAQFSILDAPAGKVKFSTHNIFPFLLYQNFSEVRLDDFDAIILLTGKPLPNPVKGNVINFGSLMKYFNCKTYAEIPTLSFLQRHPGVKLFYTNFPNDLGRYEGGKNFAKTLISHRDIKAKILAGKGKKIPTPLDKFGYNNREVLAMTNVSLLTTTNLDGTTSLKDNHNPLANVINGRRVTANQPETFRNRIWFFGACHCVGILAPFNKTIESFLQQMLNKENLPYRVENEGQRYACRYQDLFYNLNSIDPAPGDIIFIWFSNLHPTNLPFFDMSDAFDPPIDFHKIFYDRRHVNELGYKILAEKYFKFLKENDFFRDKDFNYPSPPPTYHRYGIPPQFESGGVKTFVNEELEAYKKTLRAKKLPIGALVMNCNPFTLGHQYLVEYAAARVAKLYLFVVEEDKSEFPFADRIKLVRRGVKDFSNVEVLPSGKFIISQQTFSGYFNKASLQEAVVDSSEDVEIFAKEIAPTLGITVRFAGEEPTDNVTRQYNETMKKILPRYGVDFCEIPRKTFGKKPISASTVREALKVGDFDKIKKLVPKTTLRYLRKRYSAE